MKMSTTRVRRPRMPDISGDEQAAPDEILERTHLDRTVALRAQRQQQGAYAVQRCQTRDARFDGGAPNAESVALRHGGLRRVVDDQIHAFAGDKVDAVWRTLGDLVDPRRVDAIVLKQPPGPSRCEQLIAELRECA